MRLSWWALTQYDGCSYKKRKVSCENRDIGRRKTCDDGGKDLSDVSLSQIMPGLPTNTRSWKREGRILP